MIITPSVFVIETYNLDSMTIGVTRGDRGPRPPLNFQNIIPIWPPRLREIIKIAIIMPFVFVIETYIVLYDHPRTKIC